MGGSQLKQLKASLRERGRLGPTPSKKEKKARKDQRRADIGSPPAHIKQAKFEFLNAGGPLKHAQDSAAREKREQARRDGILHEMQRKQKVGGLVDRRFGENNPNMTPEERAMERFVLEKRRAGRKSNVFDLEDDDEEGGLTHLGRPLSLKDDFQEALSDDEVSSEGEQRGKKRRRLSNDGNDEDGPPDVEEGHDPNRPRTKKEIMEEVIAKSKLHKYERQKAKEDDDDLRAELDAGVADIFALMGGRKAAQKIALPADIPMNPDRAALISGDDRDAADKRYDMNLRAMVQDKRSQPTSRTKTDEEKAANEAARLQELEKQRLRRMRGVDSEDEAEIGVEEDDYYDVDDLIASKTAKSEQEGAMRPLLRQQDVEDEDEFDLDDDLIANDSDLEALQSEDYSIEDEEEEEEEDDDEDEFIANVPTDDNGNLSIKKPANGVSKGSASDLRIDLAFTYSCPETLEELLAITKDVIPKDLPIIIQRIRALYHPGLAEGNKDRLAKFAAVLTQYIGSLPRQTPRPDFQVLESLIRHTHSLARSYPENVSEAFREHLRDIKKNRSTSLDAGDLIALTAIGTIYPTSDHFHQVVTPAMLTIGRYLENAIPKFIEDLVVGTYLSTLALGYQRSSKRYIPEVVNRSLNTVDMLCPVQFGKSFTPYPQHEVSNGLQISGNFKSQKFSRSLSFWDISATKSSWEEVKLSLLKAQLQLIKHMVSLWSTKSAFPEIMGPFDSSFSLWTRKECLEKLPGNLSDDILATKKLIVSSIVSAISTRTPLALHNHRPLAIKRAIPKFEESYNPEKRYDPDRERAESSKLRAEHKKERKAVIREFRKEGKAEAAVHLAEKKARDEAYEKNQRRLIAEIQGEEGREAKAYEREKAARKRRQ